MIHIEPHKYASLSISDFTLTHNPHAVSSPQIFFTFPQETFLSANRPVLDNEPVFAYRLHQAKEQYLCRVQITRSKAGREAVPINQYHTLKGNGSFSGTLRFRCWHWSKPMLFCYFDTDDGEKIVLQIKTLINFADEIFDGNR